MFRLGTLLLALFSIPLHAADFSSPPITLQASDVLPADQLSGANFRVEAKVTNDGLINSYRLETDSEVLNVEGTVELQERIAELNALLAMEELDRKEVFKDSVVKGVKATGEGIKELVTDPVDTTKDIVKGTGQLLSNIGQAFVSDDPSQDNALKVALGYDVAKRQFAYEFGINPYTDFEPVADRLGEIARAAVAGGITPRAALASMDYTLATVARVSGAMRGMQQLVRDNPPNKLREINLEKLRAMNVSPELSDAFLDNYSYDPYEETLLVGELDNLVIPGREVFISRASLATEKSTARFYRTVAQMLGDYHRAVSPLESVRETAGVLHAVRKDGGVVILAPVDYVFWTEKLADRVDGLEKKLLADGFSGEKSLWVAGRFDPTASAEFERRGWQTKGQVDELLRGQ